MLRFHHQQALDVLGRVFHQHEHFPVFAIVPGNVFLQRFLQGLHGSGLGCKGDRLGLLRLDGP